MKKFYSTLFVLVLFASMLTQNSFAQREITVMPVQSGGIVDGLPLAIIADSAARVDALPELTTYVLDNAGIYPCISTIRNVDFFLHIKTADPAGAKAILVPSPREDLGYNRIFEIRYDTKFENLIIEALRSYIDGALANTRQNIRLFDGANFTAIGCVIAHDKKGDAIGIWPPLPATGNRTSVFLEDCVLQSIGHFRDMGGNGRGIDAREAMDTLSIVNCTMFNLTGSAVTDFFSLGINVVIFDHNTIMNVGGPTFALGKSSNSTVTNNIFANGNLWGERPPSQILKNGADWEMNEENKYVLAIDTMEAGWDHFLENNNVYWDQEYHDMWNTYSEANSPDSIYAIPPSVIYSVLEDGNSAPGDATFTEALTFTAPPPSVRAYYDSTFLAATATIFPVNMYFGLVSDIDLSYGTSAASYTAAAGGFPLGNLNYYPDKKAEWIVTDVDDQISGAVPSEFDLSQNYPNPFNPATKINFSIPSQGKYSLNVYNLLGQEVATLLNGDVDAGIHNVTFDASNLTSGVYFYTLSGNNVNISRKMILLR